MDMKLNQLPLRKSAQSLRVDDDKYGNPGTRHVGDRIEAKCLGWDRYYTGKITKINLMCVRLVECIICIDVAYI